MLAQKLGVWIPLDEVPDAWEGVTVDLPRLRLPPAALAGPAEVPGRRLGRGEVPRGARDRVPRAASSSTAPPPSAAGPTGDHIGVHEQKDGKFYVGAAPVAGRINGADARPARRPRREVRRSPARGSPPHQKIVRARRRRGPTSRRWSRDLDDDRPRRPVRPTGGARRWPAPASSSASSRSSTPRSAPIDLVAELERRFPDLDTPITVNVNGCPNACARTQVADIGLKGQLVMDDDGDQVEGFQVHLGGGLGLTRRLRQEAARPQGDQRRPRRLRHHVVRQLPRRPRGRRVASPPGRPAPTRCCCAARRR